MPDYDVVFGKVDRHMLFQSTSLAKAMCEERQLRVSSKMAKRRPYGKFPLYLRVESCVRVSPYNSPAHPALDLVQTSPYLSNHSEVFAARSSASMRRSPAVRQSRCRFSCKAPPRCLHPPRLPVTVDYGRPPFAFAGSWREYVHGHGWMGAFCSFHIHTLTVRLCYTVTALRMLLLIVESRVSLVERRV